VNAYSPAPNQFAVIFKDITERKHVEEALRESEDKFKYIFEYSIVGKSLTHIHGGMQVNKALCDLLGYSSYEMQRKKWQEITHPEDIELTQSQINLLITGSQGSARFVKRFIHKNGNIVWVDLSSTLRCDSQNRPLYLVTDIIDITQRKQAEKKLLESESLLRTIAENYPNSYISIIEKDLTVGFTSGQEFKKLKLDPSRFVGLTLEQVFGEHTPFVREKYLKTFDGVETQFEMFINNQNQLYRTVPLIEQDGRITRIMSVVENITGRKRAEQERERLLAELDQKNKELESFVYIASHDMRSPLVTVQGFGKNIQKYCGQISEALEKAETLDELRSTVVPLLSEKIPSALHFIDSGSLKMHSLVDGLTRLSRVGRVTLQMKYVDMNLMLHHILDTLAFQIAKFNVLVKMEKTAIRVLRRSGPAQSGLQQPA
jgi:PAS domain S-box-containing protein